MKYFKHFKYPILLYKNYDNIYIQERTENATYEKKAEEEINKKIDDFKKIRENNRKNGIKMKYENPAVYIGGYDIDTGNACADYSRSPPADKDIHDELKKIMKDKGLKITRKEETDTSNKIEKELKITGEKNTSNKVGRCAEFHVVNKLLWQGSKIEAIRLIKAVRIKNWGWDIVPYCPNCLKIFEGMEILKED